MKNPILANHLVLGNSNNILLDNSKSTVFFSKLKRYSCPNSFILHFSGFSDGDIPIASPPQGIRGH